MKPITRTEARAAGLKRYFTGKPCKRGHVAERYLKGGMCIECINPEAPQRMEGAAP